MSIENGVCSIEQSKSLYGFGIKDNLSVFYWREHEPGSYDVVYEKPDPTEYNSYPAFSVAELCCMMIEGIKIERTDTTDGSSFWSASYQYSMDCQNFTNQFVPGATMAATCADMLIWLLENNHTTAEECNNRLRA